MSETMEFSTGLYLLQALNVVTLIVFVSFILYYKKDYGFGKFTTSLIITALPLSIASLVVYFFSNEWVILTVLSVISRKKLSGKDQLIIVVENTSK